MSTLPKAIDDLLALVPEGNPPRFTDLRGDLLTLFHAMDRVVWVEACRMKLEGHLPQRPLRREYIGKTNLPGYVIPGAFRVYGSRSWRNDLLALRELAAGTGRQPARHSVDFRSVHWFGTDYTFTPTQAGCIKVLWEAWENDTPDIGQAAILVHLEIDSECKRLVDVFKNHPAWKSMVVKGATAGAYRLAKPPQES
jgi:hypothetical protein